MSNLYDLEITEYQGNGYKPMIRFESWRVAVINYDIRFDENNFQRMERHHLTDEVFILLEGNAQLIIGGNHENLEPLKIYKMEKKKIYNVKQDVWHHIFTEKDAAIIVIENDNTGSDNTSYIDVNN